MALRGLVTRFGLLGRQPVESRKMTGSTVPISTSTMQQVETKKINTSSTVASVYTDSHLDALDRRKRSRSHRLGDKTLPWIKFISLPLQV